MYHNEHEICKNMSFEEYLLYKKNIKNNVNQIDFILDKDNKIMVNYLIDFNNLDCNLIKFFHTIIKVDLFTIQKALPTIKINKSNKEIDYSLYYDTNKIQLVSDIYNLDIDFFKFTFNNESQCKILWPTCINSVNMK